MTSFEKAVDKAIAEENRRFLADPEAIREAQELGDIWRQQLEDEGVLPREPEWRKRLTNRDQTSQIKS